ncbi:MAG: aminotransferase class V-fold PLP-dependent enzyme [Candidatus Dojkabacteria bacterium]|nr:MAG: aminotransferase class V-fold PLP-dependent enzyme [Candidatus Dojkabacteria bacterium]
MNTLREQFPLFSRNIASRPVTYFDYSATTPKPRSVINAMIRHLEQGTGNPGRSTHALSFEAQQAIENTRQAILSFVHASSQTYAVIFTKSATEALNLAAHLVRNLDFSTILTTTLEHHSNFLPWKRLPHKKIQLLKTENGVFSFDILPTLRKALLAITHGSNVTGQVLSLKRISDYAEKNESITVLDATQTIAHIPLNLSETPVDFLAFSGHKLYGPEGIGVLIAKKKYLQGQKPMIVGGGSVTHVSTTETTFKSSEEAFEAGTPHVTGIIGLSAALSFITELGFSHIQQAEKEISSLLQQKLSHFSDISLLGDNKPHDLPIYSFSHKTIHPHDIASFLDEQGIAVRAGFHCAEPLHLDAGYGPTTRISASFLTTEEEVNFCIEQLRACLKKYQ